MGGTPSDREPLHEHEPHRPVLRVDAHRRAGLDVRGCDRGERLLLERCEVVVARTGLYDPAARPQIFDEEPRQLVDRHLAIRIAHRVVRVAVQPGRCHDVEARLA